MIAAFSAEWLKLRKRPATWVLGVVLLALTVTLEYGLLFVILLAQPRNVSFGPGVTAETLRQALYPANFVRDALASVSGFGGAIALILGVLAMGSEYGWATLKTTFTQRPTRLAVFAGKLAAVAVVLGIFDLALLAAAAVCAALIGAYYGHVSPWPSVPSIVEGLLASWLISCVWAGFGVVLSVLFRQSALAIGLGLVYTIALEGIVFTLLTPFTWARSAERAFPGANASALVAAFGSATRTTTGAASTPLVGSAQAVVVLLCYLALFLLIGAALLRQRDVT